MRSGLKLLAYAAKVWLQWLRGASQPPWLFLISDVQFRKRKQWQ